MTPLIAEMVKIAPDPELYHWFDMGRLVEYSEVHIGDAELLMLPFVRCCVCGIMHDNAKFNLALIRSEDGDSVAVGGYIVAPDGSWQDQIEPFAYVHVDAGLQIHPIEGDEPPPRRAIMPVLAVIELFLNSLKTSGTVYKPKARPSLINSKRAAKGKGPILFDWHTITIGPVKEKMPKLGGTHASPRLHDRRGHWRKYPSGKVGWVRDCKVGDPTKGAVFKDYIIKDAL